MTALLVGQSLIFAVWTFWMFRVLFRLRRTAVAETGSSFPGPLATLRSFRSFLTETKHQRDRRILSALTLALFLLIGLRLWLASAGAAG